MGYMMLGLCMGWYCFVGFYWKIGNFFSSFFQEMSQDATNLQLVKFLKFTTTKITPKLVQYNSNKRLIAMAIATLLPTSNPTLLQYVPALLEICVNMIQNIYIKERKNRPRKYIKKNPMIKNSPCFRMKVKLEESDKTCTTNIVQFLMERLKEAQQLNGPSFYQHISQNVQPETLVYLHNPHS